MRVHRTLAAGVSAALLVAMVGVVLLSCGLVALAMPRSVVPRPGSRHGLATLFAVLTGVPALTNADFIVT